MNLKAMNSKVRKKSSKTILKESGMSVRMSGTFSSRDHCNGDRLLIIHRTCYDVYQEDTHEG